MHKSTRPFFIRSSGVVSSEKLTEEHGGKISDVSVYGQESNPTTWRLAAMSMANPPVFVSDKALAVGTSATKPAASALPLTNSDPRWEHGDPPKDNANFGWLQHMLYHQGIHFNAVETNQGTHQHPDAHPIPDATPGVASMALLLANGSMSSNTKGEGEIYETTVKADLVECMVAWPCPASSLPTRRYQPASGS